MTQVTTAEAGEILGITRRRVRQLIQAGQLTATKIGRDWLLGKAEVEQFAKRRRPPGRPPGRPWDKSRLDRQEQEGQDAQTEN